MQRLLRQVSSTLAVAILLMPMFSIVFNQTVFATGEPEITGGSNVSGLVDDYLSITGLTITGDSVDPIPVSISVPNGQLSMTTTTGLAFSTPETGSTVAFTGNKTDINNALATLRYRTTRSQTVELSVTLTNPGLVYFPGNGHFYEIINEPLDWSAAKDAAAARTVNGASGYLATVTTQEENDYISPRLSGDGWIGASDSETEGASENDWQWVTGPETGTSFWAGLSDGAPVNGLYSNWVDGVEPNNSGNEDCAQFYSNGSGWNDLPCDGFTLGSYVVEYGTEGVLPTAPSVRNLSITTSFPTPAEVPIASCLDLIDAADTNALDHRYDNLTLTQNIDCTGETVSPLFNDSDIDLGNLPFRGTFNGAGHTISNLVINQNSTDDIGLFSRTDGATVSNLTLDAGSITGQNCVGGVIGQADNTAMNNVVSTNTVSGTDNIGGIVGCYSAISGNSNIVDSFSSGEIAVSGESGGGIIGYVDVQNSNSFTIGSNSSESGVIGESAIGGLLGYVQAEDSDSSITIMQNFTSGSVGGTYNVGGMIGYLQADNGAVINVSSNTIESGDIIGLGSVGGVTGSADVYDGSQFRISDTNNESNVTGQDYYTGGLVGEVYVEGCDANTKFILENGSTSGEVSGGYYVGGLAGSIGRDCGDEDIQINNSHANGVIAGTDSYVGGLVGEANGTDISDSFATGSVSGSEDTCGLVGVNNDGSINQSYASGNAITDNGKAGGLVGRNTEDSYIVKSFATGDVSGNSRVGGLTGANGGYISDSYARGSVTGDNNVGGLSGRCGGEIERSYATGQVTGDSSIGGILGSDQGCDIVDTFWDLETAGLETTGGDGTSKTTAEMKEQNTFTNTESAGLSSPWDFELTWNIASDINDGYPCLRWQDSCSPAETEDLNGDEIPDTEQPNVGGYISTITNKIVAIDVGNSCELTTDDITSESNLVVQDPAYEYDNGLWDFEADCGTPSYTTTIKLYYYNVDKSGLVLRKHNPATKTFFNISDAVISSQIINNQNVTVVTYQVTDGGERDTDGAIDGLIKDPAGLARSVVGVPNTGF